MNQDQLLSLLRTVLKVAGALVVAHGTLGINGAMWEQLSGGVLMIAPVVWDMVIHTEAAKIKAVAANPDIAQIVVKTAADGAAAVAAADPTQPKVVQSALAAVPKAIVLMAILILGSLIIPMDVLHAQARTRHVPAITGNPIEDIRTDLKGGVAVPAGQSGTQAIQSQLEQLESKFNTQVLSDLQSALALASQKDANGQTADQTAVPCYTALISLTNLIQGMNVPAPTPPAAGSPGAAAPATPAPPAGPQVITHLEKLRIVKNALASQTFKDACAPLVQDIQSSGNQLLASVLGVVGGAAKLGIVLP